MSPKIYTALVFFLIAGSVFGQTNDNNFKVDFNSVQGELNSKSDYKSGFGRYYGYQIPMKKDETANFFVYSEDFNPKLVLVDPNGKTAKVSSVEKIYSVMQIKVPITGDWILYVAGSDSADGKFVFQSTIADSGSMYLDKDASLCTKVKFIFEHAKANFRLFEYNQYALDHLPDLSNGGGSYIDMEDGSYNATIYEGEDLTEAEKVFDSYIRNISDCIDYDWRIVNKDWQNNQSRRSKITAYKEKNKFRRYIVSILSDLSDENSGGKDYTVEILIGREGQ